MGMDTAQQVTVFSAFLYGLVSFLTPCVLPVIPGYFTFLAGTSLEELIHGDKSAARKKLMPATFAFVLGFSSVFIIMGASATYLGGFLADHKDALRIGGGVFIILMGIHITGLLPIGFLNREVKVHVAKRPVHAIGLFFVGMAFAAGWSPCVGVFLGSVLAIAATQDRVWEGVVLLSAYSFGLGLPFIVLAWYTHSLLYFLRGATRFMRGINLAAGVLLVVVGAILLTDSLKFIQGAFQNYWDIAIEFIKGSGGA